MSVTTYGTAPLWVRLTRSLRPRTGYVTVGVPLKGLDTTEEER